MRPTISHLFGHSSRPFLSLFICAFVVIIFSSAWSVQAQSNPLFSIESSVISEMPEQLSGYELFAAESGDGWAYLTFVEWEGDGQGQIMAFQIGLGEYDEAAEVWRIYGEGTAVYINALQRLPEWLGWLARMEAQRERGSSALGGGTYSIPGLPWKPDLAWRYNQGPVIAGHLNAFDFGVPVNGVQDDVYAAEDGIVIGTNGTCIIIERPTDGLRHFYQHINNSDIYEFSFGEPVRYKQRLGRTTLASGCGGATTGHHVHFAFYTPFGGPIMNPQGFVMNGWEVVGNTLVKEDDVAVANFTDTVLHDATVFEDEFDGDWLSPEWFWVREDEMNWSLKERPDFLRIYTQEGTLNSNEALPNNLLLRAAIRADYEVIVRFEGAFTENFHEAILALYEDDDNYLVVGRLFDDVNNGGDGYVFGREENGEMVEPVFWAEAGESDTELRLVVSDRFVMGFYRNSDGEWVSLGQLAMNGVDLYPFVGIGAYQGLAGTVALPIAVDFDYVVGRPITVGVGYLPFVRGGG